MEGFFKKLFAGNHQLPQPNPWRVLAHVISDVEIWCSFRDMLPAGVQLDFNHVMQYTLPPDDETPPPSYVGLVFYDPYSILLLGDHDALPINPKRALGCVAKALLAK
jgi:hypothetical protein